VPAYCAGQLTTTAPPDGDRNCMTDRDHRQQEEQRKECFYSDHSMPRQDHAKLANRVRYSEAPPISIESACPRPSSTSFIRPYIRSST
jgi:hypothetical protein